MAIKNASDLLVYKSVGSATQVTRILFKATPTSGTLGNLIIKDATNGSGTTADRTTGNVSAHTPTQAATVVKSALEAFGYTVSSIGSSGTSKFIDCTNGQAGFVPTMRVVSGTATLDDAKVDVTITTFGSSAGYEPIAFSTSASISFSTDMRDTTNKDSGGFYVGLGGLRSFEMSTDALQDFTADLDFQEFFADWGNRTEVTLRFSERLTSGVANDRYYQGNAFVTSCSMDAGVEDNVTYSVTFTGTAATTTGEQ